MIRRLACAAALLAAPATAVSSGVVVQGAAGDVSVRVVPADDPRGHSFVFETFFETVAGDRSLRIRQRLFGDPAIETSNCRRNAVVNDVVCPGVVDFGRTTPIEVTGGAGDDFVQFGGTDPAGPLASCSSVPALLVVTMELGPGADLLRSGPQPPDDANCPAGFARVYELDLTASGGSGADSLFLFGGGHVRVARLHGEGGGDTLGGAEGADHLTGGNGDDTLSGGAGDDLLEGNADDDELTGGGGSDTLRGGSGNDRLLTFGGADVLEGGSGADVLEAGDGDDTLSGGSGDDVLRGLGGDDVMSGGTGADAFSGGSGFNTVGYEDATGPVTVTVNGVGGLPGPDGVVLDGVSEGDDVGGTVDAVIGGPFGDSLTGDGSGERLEGRGGNDVIRGLGGADVMLGGDGNDSLIARDGVAETADCGPGFDSALIDLADTPRGCELVARFARDDGPPARTAGPLLVRGGRAAVGVRCPPAALVPCRGVVRLRLTDRAGGTPLASARYALPLGRRAAVRIRLGAGAAALRGQRRVVAELTERGRSRLGPRSFTAVLPVRR